LTWSGLAGFWLEARASITLVLGRLQGCKEDDSGREEGKRECCGVLVVVFRSQLFWVQFLVCLHFFLSTPPSLFLLLFQSDNECTCMHMHTCSFPAQLNPCFRLCWSECFRTGLLEYRWTLDLDLEQMISGNCTWFSH
jgi:hypothetical protein